jgi:hypothetical protein
LSLSRCWPGGAGAASRLELAAVAARIAEKKPFDCPPARGEQAYLDRYKPKD